MDRSSFDERIYNLDKQSGWEDGRDGWAAMGLLGINVLGVSYRDDKEMDPEGHRWTVYDVEYQMANGKWAKLVYGSFNFEEEIPWEIVHLVQDLRDTQKEILAELGA